MAAIKRGKHVYCEKPLAHSIGEVRAWGKAAQGAQGCHAIGQPGPFLRELADPGPNGSATALSGPSRRSMPFTTAQYSMIDSSGKWARSTIRPTVFIGTSGSARPRSGRFTRCTLPVRAGGGGTTSAPRRPATGFATPSIRRSRPWNSTIPRRSRPPLTPASI